MDGSFLEIVKWDGYVVVATRGSFESDQAEHAMKVLNEKHPDIFELDKFQEGLTYIFEVIYPENRIVVDYNGYDDLVLLTIVENETGYEYPNYKNNALGFDVVETLEGKWDFDEIKELNTENEEGWVAHWPGSDNYRVKIKFADYVELHRIVTGLSELSIWRLLGQGNNINDIIDKVPDELFKWAQTIVTALWKEYHAIKKQVEDDYSKAVASVFDLALHKEGEPVRKDYAVEFTGYKYPGMMFAILDGKEFESRIWPLIRPKANEIKEVSELPKWSN
jgi:RNA ligase